MKKHHLLLFFLFLFISCSTHKKYGACELKETDETLSFPIDSNTKNNFNIYSVYKDKDGKEYFTFQNIENNTIHFYDLKQQKPAFRITPSQEVTVLEGYSVITFRISTVFTSSIFTKVGYT